MVMGSKLSLQDKCIFNVYYKMQTSCVSDPHLIKHY